MALARIIHGFHVAKAPKVRQIGPRVANLRSSGAGILDSMSRNDERARPEMACTWRLQQGTHEYSGLDGANADGRGFGIGSRVYPRTPDRGIRGRWGQIWLDRTERATGVVGAYVEDSRRRTDRRWPQMAPRPMGGVLG